MAYQEFYCDTGGSTLNGGSSSATTATYTSTNGNWASATRIFTPSDGTTPADTVAVGDWASVYVDGATAGVFWGRVTAVAAGVNGGITIDATAQFGTPPSNSATARSIKVGGAWKGPSAALPGPAFNSGLRGDTCLNAAGDPPRVNMKAGTYSITTGITYNGVGPVVWEGYTSTVGDGGRATIDGGTSAIALLALNTGNLTLKSLIFSNNGTTGSNHGLSLASGNRVAIIDCVFHDLRGNGVTVSGGVGPHLFIGCEFYACNQSNTANLAGITFSNVLGVDFIRCIFHDNAGSNTDGAYFGGSGVRGTFTNCIFDTNGKSGIRTASANTEIICSGCDFYGNADSGIQLTTAATTCLIVAENSNFVKNGAYGIDGASGTAKPLVFLRNCGWGGTTGSNQNVTADKRWVTGSSVSETGSVTYTSHPWSDPTTGDFRITSSESAGVGYGSFTQTQASYTGAIRYDSIGACPPASISTATPTTTTAGTTSWVCPTGVTSVVAEVWGAGGGGGADAGGGGGGGGYAKATVSVTPGTSYAVVVGAGGAGGATGLPGNGTSGGNSYFSTTGTVQAIGGPGGAAGPSGAGGSPVGASSQTGDIKYGGGAGGAGAANGGGGGGSSAGTASDGVVGTAASGSSGGAGATAPTGGGNGGTGGTDGGAAPVAGTIPGGGGGGGDTGTSGAAGANGKVKLTYIPSGSSSFIPGGLRPNVLKTVGRHRR